MEQPPQPKPPTGDIERREKITVSWAKETIANEKHPERNEDSILTDEGNRAFGIFDGMGGHRAGDVASQMARDYVLQHLSEIPSGISVDEAREKFSEIIVGADRAVYEAPMSGAGQYGMGTTGTVLKVFEDAQGGSFALIGNIGDSRAYKINEDGTVTQLTVDDDLINEELDLSIEERARMSKRLSEARSEKDLNQVEKLYFTRRNIIRKAIGTGNNSPSIHAILIKKGDRFLLTSDGVHDNLTTQEIIEIIQQSKTLEEITGKLIEKSLARSREPLEKEMRAKSDDMSVVVVACK